MTNNGKSHVRDLSRPVGGNTIYIFFTDITAQVNTTDMLLKKCL